MTSLVQNTMSSKDMEIVHRLSYRPQQIYDGVISVTGSTKWKFPHFKPDRPSHLGKLDNLPLELIHECMAHMDLLSLLRLSRVSTRGMVVVESLLPLRYFTNTVKDIHIVLAKARILGLHSLATLAAALHSEKCVSCGVYGAFLHLLSAQRCCYTCLRVNQSLWVMSLPKAKKYFGLSNQHLKSLPVMWSIPGTYAVPNRKSRQKAKRLTSVRAVKELALTIYGSLDTFENAHPLQQCFELDVMKWYRQAPLDPLSQDPLGIDDWRTRPDDVCEGMGAIPFPSLLFGQIEHGHACLGCENLYEQYVCEEIAPDLLARMVPQGCNPDVYLPRVSHRVWSTAGLIDHAKLCHPTA